MDERKQAVAALCALAVLAAVLPHHVGEPPKTA